MLLTVECNYHFFLHLVPLEKTFERFCRAWVCIQWEKYYREKWLPALHWKWTSYTSILKHRVNVSWGKLRYHNNCHYRQIYRQHGPFSTSSYDVIKCYNDTAILASSIIFYVTGSRVVMLFSWNMFLMSGIWVFFCFISSTNNLFMSHEIPTCFKCIVSHWHHVTFV